MELNTPAMSGVQSRGPTPRPPWLSARHAYQLWSEDAAAFERQQSWTAAADAWLAALEVATGSNVRWCRDRYAWCMARSLKPGR